MEEAFKQMQQRLVNLEGELMSQRGMNQQLQQTIAATLARSVTRPSAVDTRGLGKPDTFDGSCSKWRDWKVVMVSYTAAYNEKLARLMAKAEGTEDPVVNAVLMSLGEKEASEHLAFILVMVCRGAALDQVVNAGSAEGAIA